MKTVGLLILSNSFMTVAWYGHLRLESMPLRVAVVVAFKK